MTIKNDIALAITSVILERLGFGHIKPEFLLTTYVVETVAVFYTDGKTNSLHITYTDDKIICSFFVNSYFEYREAIEANNPELINTFVANIRKLIRTNG